MPGELRVDPDAVTRHGQTLTEAARAFPAAPTDFAAVAGGDPLSVAAFAQQQAAESPALAALPAMQAHCTATAGKLVQAAVMYRTTDAELGSRLTFRPRG